MRWRNGRNGALQTGVARVRLDSWNIRSGLGNAKVEAKDRSHYITMARLEMTQLAFFITRAPRGNLRSFWVVDVGEGGGVPYAGVSRNNSAAPARRTSSAKVPKDVQQ